MDEKKLTVNSTAIETLEWMEHELDSHIHEVSHGLDHVRNHEIAVMNAHRQSQRHSHLAWIRGLIISLLKGESV